MNKFIQLFLTSKHNYLLSTFFLTVSSLSYSMDIPLDLMIKNIENIKAITEFKASDASVISLALNHNDNVLAVGTANSSGKKQYWGVSSWAKSDWNNALPDENILADHLLQITIPEMKTYSTQSLAFSQDDKMLIGQSDDYVWKSDTTNKKIISFGLNKFLPLELSPRIEMVKIIPNKQLIIVNQRKKTGVRLINEEYITADIYDLNTGKFIRSLKGAHNHAHNLAVNPDGSLLAAVLNDGSAIIWDINTGKIIKELNIARTLFGNNKVIQQNLINKIALSKSYILVSEKDDNIKLFDSHYQELKHWKMPKFKEQFSGVAQISITPNEKYIIFRTVYDGLIRIINIENESIVQFKLSEDKASANWPTNFIISHDSKYVIVGNGEGMVKIFDIENIQEKKPATKPQLLDVNILRNALAQLSSNLNSLALK